MGARLGLNKGRMLVLWTVCALPLPHLLQPVYTNGGRQRLGWNSVGHLTLPLPSPRWAWGIRGRRCDPGEPSQWKSPMVCPGLHSQAKSSVWPTRIVSSLFIPLQASRHRILVTLAFTHWVSI